MFYACLFSLFSYSLLFFIIVLLFDFSSILQLLDFFILVYLFHFFVLFHFFSSHSFLLFFNRSPFYTYLYFTSPYQPKQHLPNRGRETTAPPKEGKEEQQKRLQLGGEGSISRRELRRHSCGPRWFFSIPFLLVVRCCFPAFHPPLLGWWWCFLPSSLWVVVLSSLFPFRVVLHSPLPSPPAAFKRHCFRPPLSFWWRCFPPLGGAASLLTPLSVVRSSPPASFTVVLPLPLLRLAGCAFPPSSTLSYLCNTHPLYKIYCEHEQLRRRREPVSRKRSGGKATPLKGGMQRNAKGERRTAAPPKRRVEKVAPFQKGREKEEWEATYSKEEGKGSTSQRKAASFRWDAVDFPLFSFGVVVLSPTSFFGCGTASPFPPWVMLSSSPWVVLVLSSSFCFSPS